MLTELELYLMKNCKSSIKENKSYFYNLLDDDSDEDYIGIIHHVHNFKPERNDNYIIKTIQIELLDRNINTFKKFMNKKFDINVCKVMYYIDNLGHEQLYIPFIKDIITKTTTVNIDEIHIDRCNKYANRGFKFTNIVYHDHTIIYNIKHESCLRIVEIKKLQKIDEHKTLFKIVKSTSTLKYYEYDFHNILNSNINNNNNTVELDQRDFIACDDNCSLKLTQQVPEHIHLPIEPYPCGNDMGEYTELVFILV